MKLKLPYMIRFILKFIFYEVIADALNEEMSEGLKIGKHSLYLREQYIDMSSGELRNVKGGANSDTYIISISGSTYYSKNCVTGIVSTNSNFATLFNETVASMSSGGTIAFKEGIFTATAKLSLANKVQLFGSKGTEIRLGYDGTLFEINDATDCIIDGFYMYGYKTSYSGTAIVITGTSFRNAIGNNYILNFNLKGIHITGANTSYNEITSNIVEDTYQEGIMVTLGNRNTIYNNTVISTGYHGIIVTGGSYNTIETNTVDHAGSNMSGVGNFAHGIAVDGNAGNNPCYGNKVINNTIKDSYMAGIEVADAAHSTKITLNHIDGCGHGGGATMNTYGLYVGGYYAASNDCIVTNNEVKNATDRGIYISGSTVYGFTYRCVVSGNISTYNTGPGGIGEGIYLKAVEDITVTGNHCNYNTGFGLASDSSTIDYCIIADNNFRNNTLGGYQIATGGSGTMNANGTIHDNLV